MLDNQDRLFSNEFAPLDIGVMDALDGGITVNSISANELRDEEESGNDSAIFLGGDIPSALGSPEIAPLDAVLLESTDKSDHQESCSCAECMGGGTDKMPVGDIIFADIVPGDTTSVVAGPINGYVTGEIESTPASDQDWYRVTLTAGQTYTFQTILGSLDDSYLYLHNSAGTVIASNDDVLGAAGHYWSEITYTATITGTYYIDVRGYNATNVGTYALTVSTQSGVDAVPGSSSSTTALTVGNPATNGVIDVNGDHDWYAVSVVAGQSYVFSTATTSGTNVDTTIAIRNAGGTLLAYNDDISTSSTYSSIRYTATTTGTIYLDLGAWGNGETGTYAVQAVVAPPLPVFTNDQIADQLVNGYWGGAAQARHFNVAPGGTITVNITALTAAGQNLATNALALWSDVTGITFSEVSVGGQIVFDDDETGAFAGSTRSGNIITSSNVNVGTGWLTTYGTGLNTYSFQTYIHEIGHAIGLGHAGPYNGSADYGVDNSYQNDAWATTIMSYFDQTENTYFGAQGFTRQFVVSPIVADILATTSMYGTATTTRTGNTTYGFNNNSGRDIYDASLYPSVTYTVVDHGGVDTMDYSGFGQNQVINLNAEAFSNIGARVGNVTIARDTVIENAIGGSGADTITGNSANNELTGNGGADTIYGGAGNDSIYAAVGDTLLDGGADIDNLLFSVSGTVTASLANFEHLTLAGASITMTATQLLTGFSTAAAYTSSVALGGFGSLTFNLVAGDREFYLSQITSNSNFTFTINGSTGDDVVKGAINSANTINGGDGHDSLRGGQLVDTLNGGIGNDKIEGGQGADIMTGGTGVDQFRFTSANASGTGAGADRITDFVIGTDRLGFALIDADAVAAGDQAFSFIGTGAFANTGVGQIRYQNSGGDLLVQVDSDGNGAVDMEIILQGLTGQTLTGGDFVL